MQGHTAGQGSPVCLLQSGGPLLLSSPAPLTPLLPLWCCHPFTQREFHIGVTPTFCCVLNLSRHLGLDNFFVMGPALCTVGCPGFYPSDVPPVTTTKNVTHCQMSPWGENHPWLRTTESDLSSHFPVPPCQGDLPAGKPTEWESFGIFSLCCSRQPASLKVVPIAVMSWSQKLFPV